MSHADKVVAIVGRTNVGKSTLFNALAKKRVAVVENYPGVTRDRHYMLVQHFECPFTLIDTGGLVGEDENPLAHAVRAQAEAAVKESDLVLAVFDGMHGVHPYDDEVVKYLRSTDKPVLWVINKCERPLTQVYAGEFYALGVDELHFVSAAHRLGIKELGQAICQRLKSGPAKEANASKEDTIKVAIVGKPNVGKSTLVNRILGQQRMVTSPLPGTTTDSIYNEIKRDAQSYELIDTAGMRKHAKARGLGLEEFCTLRTLKAIAECDVAVLLLDATQGLPSEQDARIAGLIHERGKGLVIVVNKWDALEKDTHTAKNFRGAIYEVFKFASYAPILFVSALQGTRCPTILSKVKKVHLAGKVRLEEADLNKLLAFAFERNPAPAYHGQPVRFIAARQIGESPPRFELAVSNPKGLNFSYGRYLKNAIRGKFDYLGSDLKLKFVKKFERLRDVA